MSNILLQQLENALPAGMQIPEELCKLYQWIEDNGYYMDAKGVRYGWLFPEDKIKESWTDNERIGGTMITFNVDEESYRNELLEIQYKEHLDEVKRRLLVFARSGADGSECALWLDDEGHTQIVHIGSGSGSMMTCILVKNALDFLRLLAMMRFAGTRIIHSLLIATKTIHLFTLIPNTKSGYKIPFIPLSLR